MHTAAEERLSAELAAVEMLKSGTTTFLEAGTIRFLDEVIEALVDVGIRGKVGKWVWDLPPEPDVYKQNTDEANRSSRTPAHRVQIGRRWEDRSVVDPRWAHHSVRSAVAGGSRSLADDHGTGMSFHMSPAMLDPDGFIEAFGQRPMIHLDELGVLQRRRRP